MAFELKTDESLTKGVRRIARDQIDKVLEDLEDPESPGVDEVVHDARRRFKKLRALLRLTQNGLGRKLSDREDNRLRDAGRPLSEVRDARVLVESLDGLRVRPDASASREAFDAARKALLDREKAVRRRVLGEERALETAAVAARKARRRVKRWDVDSDRDMLTKGLSRIYRRGRRAFRAALDEATVENLHKWRKRIKDLSYASDILGHALARKEAKLAHRLADILGDDHDLAILRGVLVDDHPVTSGPLLPLIDHRRSELQSEAFALARTVYAKTPRGFVAHLDT
jgi:CHAD domain-containing protein